MTRYDPHPQNYDDARTGPQASREAAGRDETAPWVSGDGQGLRGALEALADYASTRGGDYQDQAGRHGRSAMGEAAAAAARAWWEASSRLRAVLAAHPAPEPAADPGMDVVERAAQVLYDVHGAEPHIKAHALADAGLLRNPDHERAHRLLADVRGGAGWTVQLDGVLVAQCDTFGQTQTHHLLARAVGERDRARRAEDAQTQLTALSQWIDRGNEGKDPEMILWGRVAKIAEEHGEAIAALIGITGQNPRKGVTHTTADLVGELLDVAITALGAVEHVNGGGVALRLLFDKITAVHDRALSDGGDRPDTTTEED